MKFSRAWIIVFALLLTSTGLLAQRRDALTDKESDQLREAALEPNTRLHLMVGFAKARMEAIERLRSDPNMARAQQDESTVLLDDIAAIVDEIDDNISDYDHKGEDIRKGLREVIEMDTGFLQKLKAFNEQAEKEQRKMYAFAVENALESINSSADSARATLDDENAKKGKEKIEKPEKDKTAKKDKPAKEKKSKPDYTGMGGIGQPKPQ